MSVGQMWDTLDTRPRLTLSYISHQLLTDLANPSNWGAIFTPKGEQRSPFTKAPPPAEAFTAR